MFGIKKFLIGLKIVPKTASTADSKGDLEVIDSTGKLGFHNGTSVSPVVTESHASALTNKTIDADSNTITNIEDADIKAAAAIDASKLADGSVSNTEFQFISTVTSNVQDQLDSKASATGLSDHINDTVDAHDASAISVSAISGLTATEVQAALAEHQVEIENVVSDLGAHILDTVDAHDASAISNVPSGNLAATDIQGAVDELQSDIDTRALNSDLTTHTSASTGVHGVAGSVVGTSDSQTLTNKTISGASIQAPIRSDVKQDTKANLTTYALTATNGQLVFATDTKEMFQVVDTLLEAVGGGAGIGGVDILFSQTFEEAAITDFTQTGLSLSASSPIHGAISALMTHQAVANQSFKQVIAVDEKFRGQAMLLELNVKSTASAGNVTLNVYDETNAANIVASEQLTLSSATGGIKDFVAFTIPVTCLSLSYTITALPEAGSPVTRIDDILCQLNNAALLETSVTVPNITAWQSYTPVFQGFGTPTAVEFEWRQVGENVEIRGKFTSGTSTAVESRIGLPNGYSSADVGLIPSLQMVGKASRTLSSTTFFSHSILIEPSVSYLTVGTQTSVANELTKAVGNLTITSGQTFSFFASVPVLGLTATSDVAIPLTQSGIVQEADSALYAAGNAGQSVTSIVTDIPFIPVSSRGSDISFTGSTFSVAESGIYSITGATRQTVSGSQNVRLHKNGTYVMSIGYDAASLIHPFATVTYLDSGATYSIRLDSSATLSNNSDHALTITRQGSLKQVTVNTNSKITIPTSELRFEGASSRGAVATAIVKFDTMAKIRGDAFTVTNTANDGTFVTMTKAGLLNVSASIVVQGTAAITLNQSVLTTFPATGTGVIASNSCGAAGEAASFSGQFNVAVGDVIRVSSTVTPASSQVNAINFSFQEQDIQVSVSNTLPQFSESDSCVRLTGANGFGSTATTTRRFASVVQNLGTDIEYIDSATLGGQFRAKASGIYNVSYSESSTANVSNMTVILQLNGTNIAFDNQVYNTASTGFKSASASWSGYLTSTDIITALVGNTAETNGNQVLFTISKVGKPNVTGVDVTPFVNVPQPVSQSARVAGSGPISSTTIKTASDLNVGSGLFSYSTVTGNWTVLKACTVHLTFSGNANTATSTSLTITAGAKSAADASVATSGAFTSCSLVTELQAGEIFNFSVGANAVNTHLIHVYATATSDSILTAPETFSTDTASLTYAPSSTYTLSTLANAPVGTLISFTYAINSNTRTQTTTAPTQTMADMNANGILLYGRAYNAASTAALPTTVSIQIGKGLKGITTGLFGAAAKLASTESDSSLHYLGSFTSYSGAMVTYNEITGILTIDAGRDNGAGSTTRFIGVNTTGGSYYTSGYLVINASKNPSITGFGLNRIAARAVQSSGQSIPNAVYTTVTYNASTSFDTNGALNPATGVYTAPETGYYQVNASAASASLVWSSGQIFEAALTKNGVPVSSFICGIPGGTFTPSTQVSDVIFLSKGDTLAFQVFHNRGAATALLASDYRNKFSITKVSV